MNMEKKECAKCGKTKPAGDFHKSSKTKSGLRSRCKDCTREDNRSAYHNQTPEQRERLHASWRRYYSRNRDKLSKSAHYSRIARDYGLSAEEYEQIISRGCAICGTNKGRICLDHDHATGRVRDALCNNCNRAVGNLADDPVRARALADYLERHADDASTEERAA